MLHWSEDSEHKRMDASTIQMLSQIWDLAKEIFCILATLEHEKNENNSKKLNKDIHAISQQKKRPSYLTWKGNLFIDNLENKNISHFILGDPREGGLF